MKGWKDWLTKNKVKIELELRFTERLSNPNQAIEVGVYKTTSIKADGSMNYEYEPSKHHLIGERHWWVQAEAVVGYYNAYQNTHEQQFFNKAAEVWLYTRQYLIDNKKGEWFWGLNPDGTLMEGYDKVGLWKCPYHNSRACIEMIKRLKK